MLYDATNKNFFSILDLKIATLSAFWTLFYSSAIFGFKCNSVVGYYKANISGGCVALAIK